MQSHLPPLARWLLVLLALIALMFTPPPAKASGGGGGGSAGPAPMTFVINVGKTGRGSLILQLQLVMIPATPEAAKKIDLFKPMLQHRVIQTVSGMTPEKLRSVEGRNELAEALVEELNADLDTSEKDGVKEIFFTSYIFQQM